MLSLFRLHAACGANAGTTRMLLWPTVRGLCSVPKVTVYPQYVSTSFVRSSGPGGQHVNKVNTKAEVRFAMEDAHWLPQEVSERLAQQEAGRINKSGELVLTCQETRSQQRNLAMAMQKLQELVDAACVVPKERKMRVGLTAAAKENRIKARKVKSAKKARRSGKHLD